MKKRFIFLFVLVYFSCSLFGQYPKPTSAERFLHNFSKVQVLSAADQAQIEQRLDAFEQETSNEITVVIIDDLNGDEPWHYATELGEEWGVGKADKNNGLVFLIKPTQENGGRQVYLAPGRGLEAVITDLSCHDIVQHEILPEFKKNQYAQGINKALDILFKLAKGEINEKSYRDGIRKDKWVGGIFALLFILGALFLLIKRGGGDNTELLLVADAPDLASFTLEAAASEVVLAEVLLVAEVLVVLAAVVLVEEAQVVVGN